MRNKYGFKALGLSILAVLSMMAFGAFGAQAQLPGESKEGLFLLLHPGKSFSEEGIESVSIAAWQEAPSRIVIPGRNFALGCNSLDVEESKISEKEGHLKGFYLNCTPWSLVTEGEHKYKLGNELPLCKVVEPVRLTAKIRPVSHGGESFMVLEPLMAGGPLLLFKRSAEVLGCPFPVDTWITGAVGALIVQLNVTLQALTFSPQVQLLLGTKLLYGVFPVYMEALMTARIVGPAQFAEYPWGVH